MEHSSRCPSRMSVTGTTILKHFDNHSQSAHLPVPVADPAGNSHHSAAINGSEGLQLWVVPP